MNSRNDHRQWLGEYEEMARLLPELQNTASKRIKTISEKLKLYIERGLLLCKDLQSPERRITILEPNEIAYDANMAIKKIQNHIETLQSHLIHLPEIRDEDDGRSDSEPGLRDGPPLTPVPMTGPMVGSGAAALEIPIAAESEYAGIDRESSFSVATKGAADRAA